MRFDGFVAIDWSGASGPAYAGIAVARCRAGMAAPQLVRPADARGRWTRSAVFDWLVAEGDRNQRLLVGIDMAFALPAPFEAPPQLWARIETHCAQDADFTGHRYVEGDTRFWRSGKQPADWIGHQRPAELACIAQGLGHPQTPLKLIGPKQVGLGTLAGARLLHRLREQRPARWAIWPFDDVARDDRRSACVEIYPRLFIRKAAGGNAKLRSGAALDAALQALGSEPAGLVHFDDHQADAIIAAAGLRRTAEDRALWRAGAGQERGWIFGVAAAGEALRAQQQVSVQTMAATAIEVATPAMKPQKPQTTRGRTRR
ncbi:MULTISPECIES: hypothetical protein [Hydrocarboniphaga]|uniref:DUF429 domain-containing protein n=1 Tax=Hydrocarboniphaga effusa AP103 TaxID=1172194 RepID=I7ZJW1_9GAMM|nr:MULTISPECIES: hypothetical protein [Hydrocarboniphaga]EIT72229.1 hypothetical protein WQQ_23660 [Hydrocarboniphaga effusa AP103]MDZ4079637.1 hypothetical protein [Hydrocarboniphaga sp.]